MLMVNRDRDGSDGLKGRRPADSDEFIENVTFRQAPLGFSPEIRDLRLLCLVRLYCKNSPIYALSTRNIQL